MIMATDLFNFYDLCCHCRSCDDENCVFQICHISDAYMYMNNLGKDQGEISSETFIGKTKLTFLVNLRGL